MSAGMVRAELMEARDTVRHRAASYDDDLAGALVLCLDAWAPLLDHEGAESRTTDAALEGARMLASAARLVSFKPRPEDRTHALHPHETGPTPAAPEGPLLEAERRRLIDVPNLTARESGRLLLDLLEDTLRQLLFQADVQGFSDARGNEMTYLRAATAVRRAAEQLAVASGGS